VAYRSASWSVARHYGLRRKGAIAPGYDADLVILEDRSTCHVAEVLRNGLRITELNFNRPELPALLDTVRAHVPTEGDLSGPLGTVNTIGVKQGSLLTEHLTCDSEAPGVARLSVLERHGHGTKPANAYVHGFGERFRGAIASSVGHDSHNLIVVGSNPRDMRVALASLIESGGGFSVVRDGQVRKQVALPLGGLMSLLDAGKLEGELRDLRGASQSLGCELPEPFLQLAFLSLPVIPALKLTDKGLVDVSLGKVIPVAAAS
jgi:adenine deaminase